MFWPPSPNDSKYQYLHGWTKQITNTYLRTCFVGGDLITDLPENGKEATLPDFWQKMFNWTIFLMLQCICYSQVILSIHWEILIDYSITTKSSLEIFCIIISTHLQCGWKKLLIDWCNLGQFSDNEAISTSGCQSDQYLAFARISLVYFGLIDEYCDEVEHIWRNTFQRVFVLWSMLLSALFRLWFC